MATKREGRVLGIGLAALGAAAVLGAGMVGGLLFWTTAGPGWQAPAEATTLALTTAGGIVWRSRARAARRWSAVLDRYAEREIARERHHKARPRAESIPVPADHGGRFTRTCLPENEPAADTA
jgi:hypothetical protein